MPKHPSFLLLLAGFSACSFPTPDSTTTVLDTADDGVSPGLDIDAADATDIATGFVNAQVDAGNRLEWDGAFVADVSVWYDAQGIVQAYEAKVLAPDKASAGWIFVEANADLPPVSAYTTGGPTNLDLLRDRYAVENGALAATDTVTPLWVGPGSQALLVTHADGSTTHVSLSGEVVQGRHDGDARIDEYMAIDIDGSRADAAAKLRELYTTGGWDNDLLGAGRIGMGAEFEGLGVDVGSGASEFSNFIQENRTWINDTAKIYKCNTGCTPVAFGILIEYWDRHSHPKLVSTSGDNLNTSHTDSDVRWMLDELRYNLKTYCTKSGGDGATSSTYYTKAVDHINSRGDGTWTSDNTSSSATKWSRVKSEIGSDHPVVVHYDVDRASGAIDHSGTGYEYTDNAGSTNDWICVEKGWYTGGTTWDCFVPDTVGNWHVTRVMPP